MHRKGFLKSVLNLIVMASLLMGMLPLEVRALEAYAVPVADEVTGETQPAAESTPEPQARAAGPVIYLPLVMRTYDEIPEITLNQYAHPWLLLPGEFTTYTLVLENPASYALESGEMTAEVPDGVALVDASLSDAGVYDTQARQVRWTLPEVAGGTSLTVTFQAQVTASTVLTTSSMAHVTGTMRATQVVTASDPAYLSVGEASVQPLEPGGGTLTTPDGMAALVAPAGAVTQTTEVQVSSFPVPFAPGVLPTRWQVFFDVTATGAAGAALLDAEGHTHFLQPLTATISLESTWEQPFLAHVVESDEGYPVITTDFDRTAGVMTASLQTFSGYGAGSSDPYADAGTYKLMTNQPGVAMFNGAATYSYQLDVPEGRRGLTPKISLNYNSSGMNGLWGIVQSGEVGMGWNLGGQVQIARPVKTFIQCSDRQCMTFWWSSNEFILTLNGTSYNLASYTKTADNHGCRYDVTDGPGLRVMRYTIPGEGNEYCGYPAGVTQSDVLNDTDEYWEVTTGDGTVYRLGFNTNSEQLMRLDRYGPTYPCDDLNTCAWNYWYRIDGYAGELDMRVAHRWSVDEVRDVYNNTIEYGYYEEGDSFYVDSGKPNVPYDRAQHLDWIRYSGNASQSRPGAYVVDFVLEDRTNANDSGGGTWHDAGPDYNDDYEETAWSMWDTLRLDRVKVCTNPGGTTCDEGILLAEYDLDYEFVVESSDKHIETTRLQSITHYGQDGSGALVALPATTFGHLSLAQKHPTDNYDLTYPRLQTVSNGYGGVTTFAYEAVQVAYRNHNYGSYRVQSQTTDDGSGHTSTTTYTYVGECYNLQDTRLQESCTFPGSNADYSLTGHDAVTQEVRGYDEELLAKTQHWFHHAHNEAWRMGREYRTAAYAADGVTALQQNETRWTYEDVNSTTFTYADIVTTTDYTGATPLTTHTEYQYDPTYQGGAQHGLLTHAMEYDSQNVRQRINFTYYMVDEDSWLLLPWAKDVFDGNWVWKNVQFYLYDGNTDPYTQVLTKGALTLERSLVIDEAVCPTTDRTVDTAYAYDAYGNLVSTTTYADYGQMQCVGNASEGYWAPVGDPGGGSESRVSSISYDTQYHTFPVQTCAAVGTTQEQCSGVEYYGVNGDATACPIADGYFGAVCREWGPNGSADDSTHYHYDAFGRKTLTWLPGENVANDPSQRIDYYDVTHPEWQPIVVIWERFADKSGFYEEDVTLWQRVFYDGLGRVIQRHSRTLDWNSEGGGNDIVQYTQYDGLGRTIVQAVPYLAAAYVYTASNPLDPYKTPDPDQPQTQTSYDTLGRVVQVTNPDGTASTMAYSGRTITAVDANGHQARQTLDDLGRMVQVEEFTGTAGVDASRYAITHYAYDTVGNLTAVTDTVGNVTTMSYDGLGRKLAMSDPDMGDWSYSYSPAGSLITQTDAIDCMTTFTYDPLERLTGKSYSGACSDAAVSYSYDGDGGYDTGMRTGMTYDGGSASYAYDVRGRVMSVTQTLDGIDSYTTNYTYDDLDRPVSITYPDGEVVDTTYDNAGYPMALESEAQTYVAGTSYNELGLPVEMTLGNGTVTRWGYKGMSGMWDRTGTVDPYRSYGQLWRTRVSDASGKPLLDQTLNYDNVGNVTSLKVAPLTVENWPLTTTATFADAFDTWQAGWVTTATHTLINESGNNVLRNSGPGTREETTLSRSGYTLSAGEGVQLRFKVDNDNSVAHFVLLADTGTDPEMYFGAVANGGRLFVQYKDTLEADVYRNPADLLTELELNTWYVLRLVVSDGPGMYVEVFKEGEEENANSYNLWMTTGLNWQFQHWVREGNAYLDDYYELDTSGVTWVDDERLTFTYDDLNRLTGVAPKSGAQGYTATYQYDEIGNIILMDGYDYWYDNTQPHAVTAQLVGGWPINTFTYDANGNQITRDYSGTRTYAQHYDAENRLTVVTETVSGAVTHFVYDGDGARVAQVTGEGTTVYVGEIYEEFHEAGTSVVTATKYYYLGSQRAAMSTESSVFYLHGDHLASTSLTTDQSGAIVSKQRYYPFGGVRDPEGESPTDFGFTGQRLDDSTGLMYYRARYYDASLGRFVQADTIVSNPGDPQSLNRYAYVLNNPLKYVDPTGNFSEDQIRKHLADQGMSESEINDLIYIWENVPEHQDWWHLLTDPEKGADFGDRLDARDYWVDPVKLRNSGFVEFSGYFFEENGVLQFNGVDSGDNTYSNLAEFYSAPSRFEKKHRQEILLTKYQEDFTQRFSLGTGRFANGIPSNPEWGATQNAAVAGIVVGTALVAGGLWGGAAGIVTGLAVVADYCYQSDEHYYMMDRLAPYMPASSYLND